MGKSILEGEAHSADPKHQNSESINGYDEVKEGRFYVGVVIDTKVSNGELPEAKTAN